MPFEARDRSLKPANIARGETPSGMAYVPKPSSESLEDIEDYKGFEAAIIADYDAETAVERELVLRLASLALAHTPRDGDRNHPSRLYRARSFGITLDCRIGIRIR